ncbi:hypothetical protein NTGM5_30038 [Candidatus Nitrotoga sp. M5]|nr:hypothetical protein NTGM5_30038 [Candidatus Nitrotoga sp. M5]
MAFGFMPFHLYVLLYLYFFAFCVVYPTLNEALTVEAEFEYDDRFFDVHPEKHLHFAFHQVV